MNITRPSMDESTARFWTTIFGGITAIGLVLAGIYTLVQYFDAKEKDLATLKLQVAATELAAKQGFNSKHLELCAEAVGAAGTIATSKDVSKKRLALDDFWRLYWGPLGIVEESEVASAMGAFDGYLDARCAHVAKPAASTNVDSMLDVIRSHRAAVEEILRHRAKPKPEMVRPAEAVARDDEHATFGQRLAERPAVSAVVEPGESRCAAPGFDPRQDTARVEHEGFQLPEVVRRDAL